MDLNLDRRLSDLLSEFARTVMADFPIQAILDYLVVRIVEILPIDAAGVTLIPTDAEPGCTAGSDDRAVLTELVQTEMGEGPRIAACRTGEAVAVPDLRTDDRF
ncbi:MAG: hypothetical protein ACYDAD_07545 [Acidimicrobiales bacterium]